MSGVQKDARGLQGGRHDPVPRRLKPLQQSVLCGRGCRRHARDFDSGDIGKRFCNCITQLAALVDFVSERDDGRLCLRNRRHADP